MKPTLKVTDVRAFVATIRKHQADVAAALDDLERRLDGHESVGQEVKRVAKHFTDGWAARYRTGYAYRNAPKLQAIWKRLLDDLEPEEVMARITLYLGDDDPFVVQARHSIEVFASRVNRYVPNALPLDEAFYCDHTPRCASAAAHTSKKLAEAR